MKMPDRVNTLNPGTRFLSMLSIDQCIDFAWQYDVAETQVDQWVIDYGMSEQPNKDAFKYYLWTQGLSNYDSSEKPALQRLRDELSARAWQQ